MVITGKTKCNFRLGLRPCDTRNATMGPTNVYSPPPLKTIALPLLTVGFSTVLEFGPLNLKKKIEILRLFHVIQSGAFDLEKKISKSTP